MLSCPPQLGVTLASKASALSFLIGVYDLNQPAPQPEVPDWTTREIAILAADCPVVRFIRWRHAIHASFRWHCPEVFEEQIFRDPGGGLLQRFRASHAVVCRRRPSD